MAACSNALHLLDAALQVDAWFEWVPSKANIADLPSRLASSWSVEDAAIMHRLRSSSKHRRPHAIKSLTHLLVYMSEETLMVGMVGELMRSQACIVDLATASAEDSARRRVESLSSTSLGTSSESGGSTASPGSAAYRPMGVSVLEEAGPAAHKDNHAPVVEFCMSPNFGVGEQWRSMSERHQLHVDKPEI